MPSPPPSTLGPSKGFVRRGQGMRWLKIRQPSARPGARAVVSYTVWMQDVTGGARGTVCMFLPDDCSRSEAARLLAFTRRQVRNHDLNQARSAILARADVRKALGMRP